MDNLITTTPVSRRPYRTSCIPGDRESVRTITKETAYG
jgi:hypothetical protein